MLSFSCVDPLFVKYIALSTQSDKTDVMILSGFLGEWGQRETHKNPLPVSVPSATWNEAAHSDGN